MHDVIVPQNCYDKSVEWMKNNLEVVLGIAFGIAILLVSTAQEAERHVPAEHRPTDTNGGGANAGLQNAK